MTKIRQILNQLILRDRRWKGEELQSSLAKTKIENFTSINPLVTTTAKVAVFQLQFCGLSNKIRVAGINKLSRMTDTTFM